MSLSLQVIYPAAEGTTFDYDYYFNTCLAPKFWAIPD